MDRPRKRACSIEQVGKQRSGASRFWCTVHQAPATGRFGVRLPECESAYREINYERILDLDVDEYPGGIGIWGAVAPVYDTTTLAEKAGVHVHARKMGGEGAKAIDETVEAVRLRHRRNLLDYSEPLITRETAVNYYISRFLNRTIKHLYCIHCGELHLDADYFAVKPHRKHLCHACGRYFSDSERAVSNPIALLREKSGIESGEPIRPDRAISLQQRDFEGGIQIWGSNPALIWTAARPEDEGLHLHAYYGDGREGENNTFSEIKLDGVLLNEEHVKQYMAQSALAYMQHKVVALDCPQCGEPHFDRGELGFYPHALHLCEKCGVEFGAKCNRHLVVGNPFVATKALLLQLRERNRSRGN